MTDRGTVLAEAAALLADAEIELTETLQESRESTVLRVRASGTGDGPGARTLIVKRFVTAGKGPLPYAATPEFDRDVDLAATGWDLISTAWFIGSALEADSAQRYAGAELPTRRARILHRLAAARDTAAIPELAELAGRLRAELARRWGEVPLEYAPAFRGD